MQRAAGAAEVPLHRAAYDPGWLERGCDWFCRLAILAIVVLVVVEILCRSLLGFSLQISDEVGGYALVGIAFVSPAVCNANAGFHRVEFVRERLPVRGQAWLDMAMQALCLLFSLVLTWQLVRLGITSYQREDTADTVLGTPLWLPRLPMAIGAAALCISLLRSIFARARDLRLPRDATGYR